jgi:hypothetical protein
VLAEERKMEYKEAVREDRTLKATSVYLIY